MHDDLLVTGGFIESAAFSTRNPRRPSDHYADQARSSTANTWTVEALEHISHHRSFATGSAARIHATRRI
jgi:hypothetical protein